jgi:hypothetical protein
MGRGRDVAELLKREAAPESASSAPSPLVLSIELLAQLESPSPGFAEETMRTLASCPEESVPFLAHRCGLAARLHLRKGAADRAQAEADRGLALAKDYYDLDLHTTLRVVSGQAL